MNTPAIFHVSPALDIALADSAALVVDREAVITAALFEQFTPFEIVTALVALIDARLCAGTGCYRSRTGQPLAELDEVIEALEKS